MISFYFIYFHSVLIAGKKKFTFIPQYEKTQTQELAGTLAYLALTHVQLCSLSLFINRKKGILVMTDPCAIQVHHLHSVGELYQQSTVMVKCLPLMLQKLRPLLRVTIRFKW